MSTIDPVRYYYKCPKTGVEMDFRKIYPFGWNPFPSNILISILLYLSSFLNILGALKPKYVDVIIFPGI